MSERPRLVMRLRRRLYAAGAAVGWHGYVPGSWKHAVHSLVRPDPVRDAAWPVTVGAVIGVFVTAWGGLLAVGASLVLAVAAALLLVGLAWVVFAAVLFVRETRQARATPPSSWPPGTAGVREPLRPRPGPPGDAIALDLPGSENANSTQ